ncbi:MAG: hypothetical protein ACJAVI_005734 [Candidatus Azotimanducaceae bacterium]|jgi:hypothetical protein
MKPVLALRLVKSCFTALVLSSSLLLQAQTATPEAVVRAVCIFDVDDTLTHAADANATLCPNTQFDNQPPPGFPPGGGTTNWVKTAIQQCEDLGYEIAIATAESGSQSGTGGAENPKQHTFISSLSPRFNDDFFVSPAFQTSCKVVTAEGQNGVN